VLVCSCQARGWHRHELAVVSIARDIPNGNRNAHEFRTVIATKARCVLLRTALCRRVVCRLRCIDRDVGTEEGVEGSEVGPWTFEPSSATSVARSGVTVSILHLVDLAGSERVGKSGALGYCLKGFTASCSGTTGTCGALFDCEPSRNARHARDPVPSGVSGVHLKEGTYINKSLTTLGTVIAKLAKGTEQHIPYRESKLTRLLSTSLGGNANTAVVVTVSPSSTNVSESYGSLQFAMRAKQVRRRRSVSLSPSLRCSLSWGSAVRWGGV
jgi:hypothetical protein